MFLHPVSVLSEEHHSPLIFKQRRRLGSAVFYRRACFRMMTFKVFSEELLRVNSCKSCVVVFFLLLSLLLLCTQLPNHTDVYKPLNLSDSTSMINNSSNYFCGERGRGEARRGRGEVSERGDDTPRVGVTSKAVTTPLQFERHCS